MADWGEKVTGKYKIKAGDTLTSISSALDVPADSLQLYNNISNPDKIKVGQELLWRRDPSFGENLLRWAFESDKDTQKSRDINNVIQNNLSDHSNSSSKLGYFNLGNYKNLTDLLKTDYKLDYYTNTDNLNTLYKFFRDKKWSRNQTLAILSSIIAESGGDPNKKELGGGPGEGLLQFTDLARKTMMRNYKSPNKGDNELLRQANYINDEMRGNVPFTNGQVTQWLGDNRLSENTFFNPDSTLEDLNKAYVKAFVRPRNVNTDITKRYKIAQALDKIISQEFKQGGRFTFKKNSLVKKAKEENKKDLRKKLVKSDIPNSTRNKAKKYQAGGELVDLPNILGIRDGSWNIGGQSLIGAGIKPVFAEDGIKVPEIKIDPSIFTSWNSIHSDLVIPDNTEFQPPVKLNPFIESLLPYSNKEPVKKEEESSNSNKEESNNSNKEETVNKKPAITIPPKIEEYTYKGKSQWAKDLIESYKRAGVTNPEALKYLLAQDALESSWGKSAQGKYNYGNLTTGSSWKGNYVQGRDKDAAGNPISQKFRSYNSLDEYTKDKINFLTRLYDFNQNDTTDVFISKLLGNNSGKRRYAEARNYGEVLKNVYNSVSKYQHGGTLIFGNPETSEMLTYKMEDGSLKTIPNPGAGFVSGTDPLGQVVVEGAVLNKPLSWTLGKAINWAKGLAKRSKIRSGNVNTETTSLNNTSEPIIRKEDLPEYANPNWKGDAVELTKDRLRNGGFERLENNYEGSYKYSEDHKNNILKSVPAFLKSSDFSYMGVTPENVGIAVRGSSSNNLPIWGVFQDAPELYKVGQPFFDLSSHEFSHWTRHFTPKIDKSIYEPIVKEAENSKLFKYLSDPEEWLARGTQIKNYFGLKEGEELTGDMLRYAAQNMVKDRGYDNNLTMFFKGIKDFDKMAKILSKYALGTTAIVKGVNEYKRNDKQ